MPMFAGVIFDMITVVVAISVAACQHLPDGLLVFAGFLVTRSIGQVITIRPESVMDVYTQCHCNASNSCRDI